MSKTSYEERFDKFKLFHKNNPTIYSLFKRYSLEAKRSGLTKYSIRAIADRIRWHINVETIRDLGYEGQFKLSNNHLYFYSRLLEMDEPELDGFFVKRRDDQ